MKREQLCELLGEINENYVKEAETIKKARKPVWLKWGAAAACLCLVLGIALPILAGKGGPDQNDPLRPLNVIEFNGACYESIDMADTKTLDAYGLPHEITADMIGASLGAGLAPAGGPTEQTFYQYLPYADIFAVTDELNQKRPQQAVCLVEDGGSYSFALFCNFVGFDSNSHTEASELFAVYGVDEASDIASIVLGNDHITDIDAITALFDLLYHSLSMGNDDFQHTIFSGMSEKEQQAFSTQLADSMVELQITTTAGIVIKNLCYYPSIHYVSWALNYYRLGSPIMP